MHVCTFCYFGMVLFGTMFTLFMILLLFSSAPQHQQHTAHFRSMSPSHPQSQSATPQTGLGILMNGHAQPYQSGEIAVPVLHYSGSNPQLYRSNSIPQPLHHSGSNPQLLHHSGSNPQLRGLLHHSGSNPQLLHHSHASPLLHHSGSNPQLLQRSGSNPQLLVANNNMATGQQGLAREEMADRELQASALAAAGMVAENVSLTRPAVGHILQAPPPLSAPPTLAGMGAPPTPPGVHMEGINWNMMGELGTNLVDDMDMDFANMFDPEKEEQCMQTEGSGWPTTPTIAPAGLSSPSFGFEMPPASLGAPAIGATTATTAAGGEGLDINEENFMI
jgi:hypothetical protein